MLTDTYLICSFWAFSVSHTEVFSKYACYTCLAGRGTLIYSNPMFALNRPTLEPNNGFKGTNRLDHE